MSSTCKRLGAPRLADFEKDQGPPRTPDGRYIVVRERLWRASNPDFSEQEREKLVHDLMDARRAVGATKRAADETAEKAARAEVHAAKVALGERGPVWWDDGAPDQNRTMVHNSTYADWWERRKAATRTA